MSADLRLSKRRRISTNDEIASPSRAKDVTKTNGRNITLNGTPSKNGTPGSTKSSRDQNAGKVSLKATAEDDETDNHDGAQEESDGEPRRTARQRKPSAKLVNAQNDEKAVSKVKEAQRQEKSSTTKTAQKRTVSQPIKPRSESIITPRKPGRPRKSEPAQREITPEPVTDTPRKRGRPRKEDGIEAAKEPQTPKGNAKRVVLQEKDKENGTPTNGHPEQDPEMIDLEFAEVQVHDKSEAVKAASLAIKKLKDNDFPLVKLRSLVLEKLTQRRPVPLVHLEDEYAKVHTLLEATVTAGESNSMLLVGARGSGKKSLLNKALADLARNQKEHFHVVRLNGFIQTDDKLALREIWRQLGREMDIDEEANKSYADTLTMLLALLSHPEEITGEAVDGVANSVIFIMDEFDLFATHSRQTLLYNLLDIAQSRKAPIAVLGLTTKFDVSERLEKRVKSRFSHRYVYLPLPKSMVAFHDIVKAAISLHTAELTVDEQLSLRPHFTVPGKGRKAQSLDLSDVFEAWNASVTALLSDTNFTSTYLRPIYHLTKSISSVLTSLIIPLTTLPNLGSGATTLLPSSHFLTTISPSLLAPPSSLTLILPSLSDLQLALLIAAARLDIIHDSDTCSFGMAYAEYVELAGKARLASSAAGALASGAGTRVWGRDVAKGEWEVLIRYGLLVPTNEAQGSGAIASVGALVKVDVKLEEIPGAVPGMSSMMERWCKQI